MRTDPMESTAAVAPELVPLPRRVAAILGASSVAAALGAAHLVAGFIQLPSSPYLAVGNTFIDLTPGWLKAFAIDQFGTNDKTALLTGMALVLAALGAGVGLLARGDARRGVAATAGLGVVGLIAVLTRPDTTAVGVFAPLAAIVTGVTTLRWLLRAARTSWPTTEQRTPRGTVLPVSRRAFLGTTTAVLAGAGVATAVGHTAGSAVDVAAAQARVGTVVPALALPAVPVGADFTTSGGLPFITPNAAFYRIDTALSVPRLSTADWSLRIHGMVEHEITLRFDQLVARELLARRVTLSCVSYSLGSDLVGTADWTGVSLRALLLEAGVHEGADQLFSTSADGFTASTPVRAVMEPDRGAMLAVNMNGQPLPVEHGFPVRMVVPGLFGFVSATKWITDIELTTYQAKQAYWTPRGWSDHGPVKQASKIVSSTSVASGSGFTTTVTGAAWEQHVGITGVEVRLDGGAWQPARLGADGGRDAWRMWRADFTGVTAGAHTAQCRATNTDGTVQTQTIAATNPDGATGWHTARVLVS